MNSFRATIASLLLLSCGAALQAQGPQGAAPQAPPPTAPAAQQPPPASGAAAGSRSPGSDGTSTFLGKDVPFFNPGNEVVMWDGKSWNINDNRVFQARFEKFLNAPEETAEVDLRYHALLHAIMQKLAPENATRSSLDEAFRLLPQASNFDIDANLCDSLASAVYSVWQARREDGRLALAQENLEKERRAQEWNTSVASSSVGLDGAPPSGKNRDASASAEWAKEQQLKRETKMQPYVSRLVEINGLLKLNKAKSELSELQTKIEFQALIVQFFLQRRFQHVVIATRFYRQLFAEGDTTLKVGKDAQKLFAGTTGMPPTVGVLDALANEAMRDVRESVQAFEFLLKRNELESATKRLAEAFTIGEYMPEMRTLKRDDKRQALTFAQKSDQLLSAIEVKDYALADKLVKELGVIAKDFDNSKPLAVIETARTVSAMHLAKAKNAAVSGDRATLEVELKEATEVWPRNPALAEVSGLIFSQADVQQKALVDLDQLLSQKNYRQIFDDKIRFIAATALYPERQEKLRTVLDSMQVIEGAILRANEIAKLGDYPRAWESVERVFKQFPDDNKLNQVRANLTTQAADFVRTLRTAEDLETRNQAGSSLAWYLRAQQIFPASEFAQDGVARLVKKILPEAPVSTG